MTDIRGIIHIAKKGACQLTHLPAELPLAKRPDSGTSLPVNTTREKNKIFWFTTTYEIHYRIWRTFITKFGGLLLPNLAKKHVKVAKIPTSQRMRSGEFSLCYSAQIEWQLIEILSNYRKYLTVSKARGMGCVPSDPCRYAAHEESLDK